MDQKIVKYLRSIGVSEPICQTCLSEDFEHFVALSGQVLWCTHCSSMLNYTASPKPHLIYSSLKPTISSQDNIEGTL